MKIRGFKTCVAAASVSLALVAAGSAMAAPKWLAVNAHTKTATVKLISAYNNNAYGYNFDGYAKGKMVVFVPQGWKVTVVCKTAKSASVNHSCAVVKGKATKPAFAGAESANPTSGYAPGKGGKFTFTASKVGFYHLVCLVPGHSDAGMWDVLRVTKGGKPHLKIK